MKNNVWVLPSTDEESQLRLLGVFATLEAAQSCPCVQGLEWEVSSYGDFEAAARISPGTLMARRGAGRLRARAPRGADGRGGVNSESSSPHCAAVGLFL